MHVVCKYTINHGVLNSFLLPQGAVVRAVGCQRSGLQMWVEQSYTHESCEPRVFVAYFTGEPIVHDPQKLTYVGTTQRSDDYGHDIVAHVYEVLP